MVPVDDLDRARRFYTEIVGLREIARFDPPGLVFVDLGGVRLLLERGATPSSSVLYLSVDDIAAETERLRAAGATITGEPHVIFTDADGTFGAKGAEERMAFFTDSEGNTVGLSERRLP